MSDAQKPEAGNTTRELSIKIKCQITKALTVKQRSLVNTSEMHTGTCVDFFKLGVLIPCFNKIFQDG